MAVRKFKAGRDAREAVLLVEFEAGGFAIRDEVRNQHRPTTQEPRNERRRLIAATQPDHFRMRASQGRDVREIGIEGNNRKTLTRSEIPDFPISSLIQSEKTDLLAVPNIREQRAKPMAQVLIEKELHAVRIRRSRSAA